jgi:glycogen operon protein
VLASVKLIAEPWDVGDYGYQVGNFPPNWSEWNGKYRDGVRRFWKGDEGQLAEFATRLSGSADLYQASGRNPRASINFVTAHDGFTLRDLVSYEEKHNEANGEDNQDGANDNESWNGGAEGETDDPDIRALRARQQRNFLATLFCSLGVPMLAHGDELGRTQGGNNNAYCQDNEISWVDWTLDGERNALLSFTKQMIQLRKELAVLRSATYPTTNVAEDPGACELAWFQGDGQPISDAAWTDLQSRSLAMRLAHDQGSILLLVNAHWERVEVILPPTDRAESGAAWEVRLDTNDVGHTDTCPVGSTLVVEGRSMMLLSAQANSQAR